MTDSRPSTQITTLRQLIAVAFKVLPSRANELRLLKEEGESAGVMDESFGYFVLDSRQMSSSIDSASSTDSTSNAYAEFKNVFVLLKSHTQSLEKSIEYAKTASQHAAFIISELGDEQLGLPDNVANYACPVVAVPHIREVLGTLIQLSLLSEQDLEEISNVSHLAKHLPNVVAVTGTNGKTTISQLVAQLCQLSNLSGLKHTAVMGTAGNGRLDNLVQSSHTTGDALAVQTFLRQMGDEKVDVLALEASSHGLDQLRLQGVPVQVAIYTNLSRDHLDYHSDMQDYAGAKARLFDKSYFPQLTHAIINLDDEFAPIMLETAASSGVDVWTYSLNPNSSADFVATHISPSLEGAEIRLTTNFGTITIDSPLLGRFNVANVIAAVASALALGVPLDSMAYLAKKLQGANGRMQRVLPDKFSSNAEKGCFIVDYAHTPDALTQVLTSLKPHCEGKLWAVFGCGGDRDRGKRPLMAQAGLAAADRVILTSDNPRSEDPSRILQDMTQGMSEEQHAKTAVIADRRQAIKQVVEQAGTEDIVVIAGKGHETYQEVNGVRYNFDDRRVLQEAFSEAVE